MTMSAGRRAPGTSSYKGPFTLQNFDEVWAEILWVMRPDWDESVYVRDAMLRSKYIFCVRIIQLNIYYIWYELLHTLTGWYPRIVIMLEYVSILTNLITMIDVRNSFWRIHNVLYPLGDMVIAVKNYELDTDICATCTCTPCCTYKLRISIMYSVL